MLTCSGDSASGGEGRLVALIGIIDIHVWNATADRLEWPDRMVFDLNAGEAVEWRLS
jgi:DNA primase